MRSDELETLIGAAFDRLPEPDSTRLREVEERLARRASRRFTGRARELGFWWLLAALAATGAAAWWGGEYLADKTARDPIERRIETAVPSPAQQAPRDEEGSAEPRSIPPTAPPGPERQIYRRERY